METKIDLREEILRISAKNSFAPRLIEKDYHLTRILHKISERNIENLVFKGGTCLNKCYLGFYRLSEDLDFVLNQDVNEFSRSQVKRILDNLRREIFGILDGLGLETNKKLGIGWKMITSKKDSKILGLEVATKYKSVLDDTLQNIKIEISFRNALRNPTKRQPIHHDFVDALGEFILEENVEVEVIDLVENFAEKFRALVTRENIAIRDIFDIYFILDKDTLNFDKETRELVLIKINETPEYSYKVKDFEEFIEDLHSKVDGLNEKELSAVLRDNEEAQILEMIKLIKKKVLKSK